MPIRKCSSCGKETTAGFCPYCNSPTIEYTPPPTRFPVSKVCPACGSTEFKQVRPNTWIAFSWDRVCKGCNTRYTPPTPIWAGIVFIVIGLPLLSMSAVDIFIRLINGQMAGVAGIGCTALLGILGLLAMIHGIRSLANPGKA